MDKQTFYRWFRQAASQLGVPEVNLRFMTPAQARGEYGRYEPGENVVYIEERQLQSDTNAIHTALHELAHAIVFKNNSQYLEREGGRIRFDLNNNLASMDMKRLRYNGGHNAEWKRVASGLNVDVSRYVDKEPAQSAFGQIRFGLGFRRH